MAAFPFYLGGARANAVIRDRPEEAALFRGLGDSIGVKPCPLGHNAQIGHRLASLGLFALLTHMRLIA